MCDYYDIQEILYEDERVPCVFNTDAMNIGYLDPAQAEDDLESGSEVAIPLWMAHALARTNMVTVKQPRCFNSKVRNALMADPAAVNLRDKNAYYYELGLDLSALAGDAALPAALRRVLAVRYGTIFDTSTNSRNEDTTEMMKDLTNLERQLFEAGYEASDQEYNWKTRRLTRLHTADIFRRSAKRRRLRR